MDNSGLINYLKVGFKVLLILFLYGFIISIFGSLLNLGFDSLNDLIGIGIILIIPIIITIIGILGVVFVYTKEFIYG